MTVTVAPGIAPLVESTTCPTIPEDADSWALSPAVRSQKATIVMLPSLRVMLLPPTGKHEQVLFSARYRITAPGNPPPAGITCPVVFALGSPASQQMAFAQSRS